MTKENISNNLLVFIKKYFSVPGIDINYQTDLFDTLTIDSTDLTALIHYIESNYNIEIKRRDLIKKNFKNIFNISQFILDKIN